MKRPLFTAFLALGVSLLASGSEAPTTMALQTRDGRHLGFVLFAKKDSVSGDCIVRALPKEPVLLDSREYRFLCECQDAGEFHYRVEGDRRIFVEGAHRKLRFERNSGSERFAEKESGLEIFGVVLPVKNEKKS
jgi:hypothetical protein